MTDAPSDTDQSKPTLSTEPKKKSWDEVFAELDAAGIPEDFAADRDRSLPSEREGL
jgi:hypothetical protein